MSGDFKEAPTTERAYGNCHALDDKRWGWEGWKLAMEFEKTLREISGAGQFDNIGNWARNKAREVLNKNYCQERRIHEP